MPVKKFTTKVELTNTQSASIPEDATQYGEQVAEARLREKALAQLDMMLPPGWERGQAENGSAKNGKSGSAITAEAVVKAEKTCDRCGSTYTYCLLIGGAKICWDCIDGLFDEAYR